MALPAGLSPATRRFEAACSDILSYGSLELEPTRRLALPRGINARQFTKLLLSLLSHAGLLNAECRVQNAEFPETILHSAFITLHSNGGSPRCCPVLCGLRDRCIAAMLAT